MKATINKVKENYKEYLLVFFVISFITAIGIDFTTPHTSGMWDDAIMCSLIGIAFTMCSIHGDEL